MLGEKNAIKGFAEPRPGAPPEALLATSQHIPCVTSLPRTPQQKGSPWKN